MAKALTPKTRVIREAILTNPDKGPKALSKLINEAPEREDDKVRVTPGDVAGQQVAMRKAGASMPEAPAPASGPASPAEGPAEEAPQPRKARKPRVAAPDPAPAPEPPEPPRKARKPEPAVPEAAPAPRAAPAKAAPTRRGGLVGLLDRVVELAEDCGGLDELRRVVDRLIQLRAP